MQKQTTTTQGLFALSPLLVFLVLYGVIGALSGGVSKVPIIVVFLLATLYSLFVMRGCPLRQRMEVLFTGTHQDGLMQMIWIFILAGAYSAIAKQMGAINAMVDMVLFIIPSQLILAGILLASCLISLCIGTSVGTIVALTPIASGIAEQTGTPIPLIVGAVVGGAFFGDNLSFISDTTIVATRTQGCKMKDKFWQNLRIALPAALISMVVYVVMGMQVSGSQVEHALQPLLIVPYLFVLVAALCGMDVMLVLIIGCLLATGIGMGTGSLDVASTTDAVNQGIMGVGELIIVTLMAACMMSIIRFAGGISYILSIVTKRIRSTRAAELSIGLLVFLTNLCTANNTIAILTIGPVAHDIAQRCNVDPRRSASLLDTFSCFAQGMLPYGAQMLMASALAGITPLEIIPYLYYPFILGAVALAYILVRPKHQLQTPEQ